MLVELRSSEGSKCPGSVVVMQFCSNQLRTEPLYLCPKNLVRTTCLCGRAWLIILFSTGVRTCGDRCRIVGRHLPSWAGNETHELEEVGLSSSIVRR